VTAWALTSSPKAPGYRTLTCRCPGCGRLAAVVIRTETLVRLVRNPDMMLQGIAGSLTLRTGRHRTCQTTKERALCPPRPPT
jgi:hypothetical protein